MAISPTAARIATQWSGYRKHPAPAALRQDIAEQVQSHLNHGAEPQHLTRVAWWMAVNQPGWFDLSLAMQMSSAPKPRADSSPGPRANRSCACRSALVPA